MGIFEWIRRVVAGYRHPLRWRHRNGLPGDTWLIITSGHAEAMGN